MRLTLLTMLLGAVTLPVFADQSCDVGVYGQSRDFVVITRTEDGFRYGLADGRVGDPSAPDATVVCAAGSVIADGAHLPRQPLRISDTTFDAEGTPLRGRLIEPMDAGANTPLVVYAHGSERSGWIDHVPDPYQMVARGISVFVFDKRGTGQSGGRYSQNIPRLASDLVFASGEARRLAGERFGRFGFIGLSQGGWVAPYAAAAAGAEFVAVGYGLVASILEEDAAEIDLALREAGYGSDVIRQARRITDATARIATTGSEEAVRALEPLRAEFAEQPWIDHVEGDFTGLLFNATTEEILTSLGPYFESLDVDWSVDPVAVVAEVTVPQLWVLAGADREAPIDLTLDRLRTLQEEREDMTVAIFPEADHGMWEFETGEGDARNYMRIASGYYDLVADWILGDLSGPYGSAILE
ncbi:MAG: alpha/beta fold hydrolase [Pseudomonadota bacterium]